MGVDTSSFPRFWDKVAIGANDACWHWKCGHDGRGYGKFWYAKSMSRAHRIAYMLTHQNEILTESTVIRHQCDNPPCCNPSHLCAGSRLDNNNDMLQRRRHWAHALTHCNLGHPLDGLQSAGYRRCTTCYKAKRNARERYRRQLKREDK